MAPLRDVFSTTVKVLISLTIISFIVALVFHAFGGMSMTAPQVDDAQTTADETRTRMPSTKWERGIAKAIKEHCVTDGMNEEETVRSLGEPAEKSQYTYYGGQMSEWTWKLKPGECLKYDGDNCIEREPRKRTIQFTAKGNVFKEGAGCISLDGRYFDNQALFGR